MTPEMERRGYPRSYIGGLASVSGILGSLIPPSVPMVVYGISANVAVGDMFIAGIVSGLVLLTFMLVVNHMGARRRPDLNDRGARPIPTNVSTEVAPAGGSSSIPGDGPTKTLTRSETTTARRRFALSGLGRTAAAVPALLMPVIISGGIYGGIVTRVAYRGSGLPRTAGA